VSDRPSIAAFYADVDARRANSLARVALALCAIGGAPGAVMLLGGLLDTGTRRRDEVEGGLAAMGFAFALGGLAVGALAGLLVALRASRLARTPAVRRAVRVSAAMLALPLLILAAAAAAAIAVAERGGARREPPGHRGPRVEVEGPERDGHGPAGVDERSPSGDP
jgi:hypothetical protein